MLKIRLFRSVLPALTIVIVLSMLFAANGQNKDARRLKARHFYLQGAIHEAQEEADVAYEFYKKAHQLDPDYIDASSAYGTGRMNLPDTFATRSEMLVSLAMAKGLVEAYPADPFTVIYYSYLSQVSDSAKESLRVLQRLDSLSPGRPNTLSHLMYAYSQLGEIDSALSTMRRIERVQGVTFESTVQKVQLHLVKKDTLGVIGELSELVAQNPKSVEYTLTKAKVLSMLGMQDSAILYLKRAEQLDNEDGAVKNEIARFYAENGDTAAYHKYTKEALLAENLSFEVKAGILKKYVSEMLKNHADTVAGDRIFEVLSQQYPHEPEMLAMAARYAASKGDYEDAVSKISYAIDLRHDNTEYFRNLMFFHFMMDKYERVVEDYDKAEKDLGIFEPNLALMYASAAVQTKEYDKSLRMYDRLIKNIAGGLSVGDSVLDKKEIRSLELYDIYQLCEYYQGAGDVYYMMDSVPQAFTAYEISLALYPYNALAMNNYAYFLVEKGKVRPGEELFAKALRMSREVVESTKDDPNPTYLDTYAWILFLNGDIEEAEKFQRKAIETAESEDSVSAELYDHYGDILEKAGRVEEARKYWERVLTIEPENEKIKEKLK